MCILSLRITEENRYHWGLISDPFTSQFGAGFGGERMHSRPRLQYRLPLPFRPYDRQYLPHPKAMEISVEKVLYEASGRQSELKGGDLDYGHALFCTVSDCCCSLVEAGLGWK